MSAILWCKLVVRGRGGTLLALAALHAGVVAWVGWYLAEAGWSAMPLRASRTPLSSVTFVGSAVAGTLLLLAVGPAIGAGTVKGPWIGPDPTNVLPVGPATRLASAWVASCAILAVVGCAPLPIYLSLYEMGAFTLSEIGWLILAQSASIALAPLAGIAVAMARRGRSAV